MEVEGVWTEPTGPGPTAPGHGGGLWRRQCGGLSGLHSPLKAILPTLPRQGAHCLWCRWGPLAWQEPEAWWLIFFVRGGRFTVLYCSVCAKITFFGCIFVCCFMFDYTKVGLQTFYKRRKGTFSKVIVIHMVCSVSIIVFSVLHLSVL